MKTKKETLSKFIRRAVFAIIILLVILSLFFVIYSKKNTAVKGDWNLFRTNQWDEHATKLSKFIAHPYLAGYNPAPKQMGTTVYNKSRAYNGLNLYISGHAPAAFLIDMQGKTLHRWYYNFRRVWPECRIEKENKTHDLRWRRVYLYKNGDLLANYEGIGLIKIDKNSKLLWAHQGGEHHDMDITDAGLIYVLSRHKRIITRIHKTIPILEDFITILDSEGNEIKRISLLECFEKLSYNYLLVGRKKAIKYALKRRKIKNLKQISDFLWNKIKQKAHIFYPIDFFHTNALEVFDGKLAYMSNIFKKGNILISFCGLNTIAIVDLDAEKVVWVLSGNGLINQHHPTLLKNGNILIFNNRTSQQGSNIIEFNPLAQKIVWEYRGSQDAPFYSCFSGSCQRLPNGNTLITESNNGRSFEVTPSGKIVWEFINPHRAGNNSELIATLFEVIRLESTSPLEWLAK